MLPVGVRRKQTASLICIEIPTRRADLYKRIDWNQCRSIATDICTLISIIEDRVWSVSGQLQCYLHDFFYNSSPFLFRIRVPIYIVLVFYIIRAADFSTATRGAKPV